jgi:Ni/Fe-hydrogenase subunit HybB-like protein
MSRVRRLKFFLWVLTGLAAAVGAVRFLFGLGATTNLSDATPWGVWIGFDVMSGVALAAGGFIVTATVYIFKLDKFHSIVRPAVLTAFLGYMAVAVGLLFDLGLPWNIWHMLVYWNPHSPLFEVGWCVMLYLTVLSLEFFPVPAEEFGALAKIRRVLLKIRLPLVIAGIGLSTLHQSSLGSLFLIMPNHLHPLWYSPLLPVLFFVSAICLGLMMVTFESHTTAYLYHRKPETNLMARLGGAVRWVLLGYLVLRFADLAVRGELYNLMGTDWQILWFWFELSVMVFIPFLLFSIPAIRRSRAGQWSAAFLGVAGVVLNRVNVGGFMHQGRGDTLYIPSWTELTISAGVVSIAVLVFLYFIERFKVWEERPVDPEADPTKLPELHAVGSTWLGVPVVANRTVYSLAFIIAAAIGLAFLAPQPATSIGVDPAPVHHARGGDTLWVDGNLDGFGVQFPHAKHVESEGGMICAGCHHMNLPRDTESGCYHCHSDMYMVTDAFRHDWHASSSGAGVGCIECHAKGEVRTADTAKGCAECHGSTHSFPHDWHTSSSGAGFDCEDCHTSGVECTVETAPECAQCHNGLVPACALIEVKQYQAIGYVSAMHQLCIGCHAELAQRNQNPDFARCAHCHRSADESLAAQELRVRHPEPAGKRLVLPIY